MAKRSSAGEESVVQFEIPLTEESFINLEYTLSSGQVFRWRRDQDGWWYGALGNTGFALTLRGNALLVEAIGDPVSEDSVANFLGLADPLPAIRAHLSKDSVLARAFSVVYGLRLVRQDPWEALISFVCSSNNSVTRIEQMMDALARYFGVERRLRGHVIHTFPRAEVLASLSNGELRPCRLGYREAYVQEAARRVAQGELSLSALASGSTQAARSALLALPGVGQKVCDCILLLGFGRSHSAFPVDVWVRRAVIRHYREAVRTATGVDLPAADKPLTERQRKAVVEWAQLAFCPYVGYAQAYLFASARAGFLL